MHARALAMGLALAGCSAGSGSGGTHGGADAGGASPSECARPASFRTIAAATFDQLPPTHPAAVPGWTGRWGANADPNTRITSDPGAPASPPGVLEAVLAQGLSDGAGNGTVVGGWDAAGAVELSEIYESVWLRINGGVHDGTPDPDTYENHAVLTKLFFLSYGHDPAADMADNDGIIAIRGENGFSQQTSYPIAFLQQNNVNVNWDQPAGSPRPLVVGRWHQIEILARLNTLDVPDGSFRLCVDGMTAVSSDAVTFIDSFSTTNWAGVSTGPYTHGFQAFSLAIVWGGRTGTKTRTDYLYFDDVVVAGLP